MSDVSRKEKDWERRKELIIIIIIIGIEIEIEIIKIIKIIIKIKNDYKNETQKREYVKVNSLLQLQLIYI